jgi:hypothetical protein
MEVKNKPEVPAKDGASEEQRADFARLAAAAAEPDAEVQKLADSEAAAEVQAEQSLTEKNAAGLMMMFALAEPVFTMAGFPTVAGVLSAPSQDLGGNDSGMTGAQALSSAWAPVLAKYNIDLSNMANKYNVEIIAVMTTIPVAKALYAAIKADSTKGKRDAARIGPATGENPVPKASEHVTLGTVSNE